MLKLIFKRARKKFCDDHNHHHHHHNMKHQETLLLPGSFLIVDLFHDLLPVLLNASLPFVVQLEVEKGGYSTHSTKH